MAKQAMPIRSAGSARPGLRLFGKDWSPRWCFVAVRVHFSQKRRLKALFREKPTSADSYRPQRPRVCVSPFQGPFHLGCNFFGCAYRNTHEALPYSANRLSGFAFNAFAQVCLS
jgi:hypothetical protein